MNQPETFNVTRIVLFEHNINNPQDKKKIILGVAFGVVGVILLVLVIFCLCQSRRKSKSQLSSTTTTSLVTIPTASIVNPPIHNIGSQVQLRSPQDVARRYERSTSNLSTKSQIYLVPFDVLPSDFDYSSKEVEVRADYVILKNLALLENHSNHQGTINEAFEYEQQSAYNPSVYVIPPLIQEPYKKQDPYNTHYVY